MSEITRGVMGMPYEMAMGNELSRRQFYDIAREVYAENERLQKSSDHWKAMHDAALDSAKGEAGRADRLQAENESLFNLIREISTKCDIDEFDSELNIRVCDLLEDSK